MSRRILSIFALILWLAASEALAETAAARLAGTVKVHDEGGDVVVTVPLTEVVPWKVWLADGPPRLIVEFNNLEWDGTPEIGSSSIAEVRVERADADWLRVIAYLREPLAVVKAEMHGDGAQDAVLELVLGPTTGSAFQEHAGVLEERGIGEPRDRPRVVLDPGHGGRDPGANAGEFSEADLMLDFAFHLRDALDATGLFDVVLTRDADTFVPLHRRMSLARDAGADVFLSLHADRLAEGSGEASGLTLYALGRGASAEASADLVGRHANDDLLKDVDLSGAGDDVAMALLALQRQDTDPRTAALSAKLLGAFRDSGLTVNSRPERQGDFAVLKAADFPSLLIELGFLSSEVDLERLTSEEWRDAASAALRDGLMLWFQEDEVFRSQFRK